MEYELKRINNIVHSPPLQFSRDENKGLGHFFYTSFKKHGDKIFQKIFLIQGNTIINLLTISIDAFKTETPIAGTLKQIKIDAKTGQSESYSTVLQKSIRTAMEMRRLGIKEGDTIVLCSTNCMNAIIPIIATSLLNAVIVNLDPSLSLRDCVYLLNIVQHKMIFVKDSGVELVDDIVKQLEANPQVVVMGDCANKHLSLDQFLRESGKEDEFHPAIVEDLNSLAVILFTSGSAGMPKPVKLSHHCMLASAFSLRQMNINPRILFHISSFYWISAYVLTLITVGSGGRKIIESTFKTKLFMDLIQTYKITFAFLPTNIAYQFTKENTTGYNTSSIEDIIFGGSVINEEQLKKCKSYFSSALISNGYGQTEASNFITVFTKSSTTTLANRYPGSCGVPLPGTSMMIVNPDTEELLPPNKIGEVRVHSDTLFIGYHHQDSSESIDSNGFLKTGDVGYINEDHCLYIVDRIKDMFKYKSWHIVPTSVEKVIYQHPAVKEAVVLGIPSEEDGEHPMALVVLHAGYTDIIEEDIQNFVDARVLEREKLRAGVKIISEFPRTVTGKIVRRKIRSAVIEGSL